jgi:hypothetical protein
MSTQSIIELALGLMALALLARDLYRAARDPQRRPMTLFVAAAMVVLLAGVVGSGGRPSAWWLAVPAGILAWEVARGWRRTPRCHLREAAYGAFGMSLVLAALGLEVAHAWLDFAVAASAVGLALLWLSRRREPRPWRADDVAHYERRVMPRTEKP